MMAEAVVSVGPQFANQRDKFMDELCKKINGLGFVSDGVSGDTRNFKLAGQDGISSLNRRAKTESTYATSIIGFSDCRHMV